MLLRVLPSVYPLQPKPIHQHIAHLLNMMPRLDPAGRQHLLRLLQMVAEEHPLVSERVREREREREEEGHRRNAQIDKSKLWLVNEYVCVHQCVRE